MAPFIFMEKNGIHIIDLHKTLVCIDEATNAVKGIVRSGRKVLFVATKKQAKSIVEEEAKRLKMPYVTERWLGGMLTNFTTIRKSLKKLDLPGAMFGGLILGVLEMFGSAYISTAWKDVFVFLILILVLILRPNGLFGEKLAEKV